MFDNNWSSPRHWVLGIGAVGVLGLTLTAALTTRPAVAQIANTKHNLTASNTIPGANRTDSTDICVFCHTPHGSASGATVPLWNKALPDGTTFTRYADVGGGTLDGTVLTVGSVSLACLSCHDGVGAMDNVINAPGPGANTGRMAVTWTGTRVNTGTGQLTGFANLGQDLSNDHPIGIPYGGGTGTKPNGLADADFKEVNSGSIGGVTRYWVDVAVTGAAASVRDKTDMILYSRSDAGALTNIGYVECATCHDPHVDVGPVPTGFTGTPPAAGQGLGMFLRVYNASSAVCLSCHVK